MQSLKVKITLIILGVSLFSVAWLPSLRAGSRHASSTAYVTAGLRADVLAIMTDHYQTKALGKGFCRLCHPRQARRYALNLIAMVTIHHQPPIPLATIQPNLPCLMKKDV